MKKSSPYRGVTLFRPTMKWRAQISANGKTTSLGDHDTEEQAATAFDRAAINKGGKDAKTNFPIDKYTDEIADLQAMDLEKLVAMLRSKARKSGTQTSHFRGVSLLKQTARWHAQINVGGKQVHLGFFPSEEYAARAYDRASINKGAKETGGKITTNFEVSDYSEEIDLLRRVSQTDLVAALSTEMKRKQAMQYQEGGPPVLQTTVGKKPQGKVKVEKGVPGVEELMGNAQRAQPKSTLRNPLYQDFGIKKPEGAGAAKKAAAAPPAKKGKKGAEAEAGEAKPAEAERKEEAELPEDRMIACAMLQCREGFDRLLAGADLPSLANGPILELPLVHPMTGAPKKVAGPLDSHESAGPKFVTPKPKPKPKAREAPKTPKKAAAAAAGGDEPPKTPAQRRERARAAIGLRPKVATKAGPEAEATPAPVVPVAGKEAAKSSPPQVQAAPATAPKPESQPAAQPAAQPATPPTSPKRASKRASPAEQPTPPKAPPAKRKRGTPKVDPDAVAAALTALRSAPKDAPATPTKKQAPPPLAIPPSPPSAGATPGRRVPGAGWRMAGAEDRQPVKTLQDRLRETEAQQQRNAERPAPAPVQPDPTPLSPGRPLTKRQEALAIRKTEEAAATLAGVGGDRHSPKPSSARQTPLPEEVGAALMDFAAAAELAEEEDRRQDEADILAAKAIQEAQNRSTPQPPPGMWLADLLKSLPAKPTAKSAAKPAPTGDTASTVSDNPGAAKRSAAGHLQEVQSRKRARV